MSGLPINQGTEEYLLDSGYTVTGWSEFAALNPTFALVTETGDTKITMTSELMDDLKTVNDEVNDRNTYKRDIDTYGELEHWSLMSSGASGDCEDFALTKAQKLLGLGYPASAIKIEVGDVPDGRGHCWLVVQTDKGDMVLDI